MSSVTLWAADDHLLQVEVRGFTEIYRRFYFRDMQAIIIRPTGRVKAWILAFGLLTLATALVAALDSGLGWNIFWWSLAGVWLSVAVAHLALGPGCECALRTPLQTIGLPSLGRLRSARRVLEALRPMIELDQGALTREEMLARLRERAGAATPLEAAPDPASPPPIAPPIAVSGPREGLARPVRHDSGRAHEVLAYVLLLSAAVAMLPLLYFNVVLNASLSLVFVGRVVCIVVALARQNHSDLSIAMKRFAWTAFGWECVTMAVGFFGGMVLVLHLLSSGRLDPASTAPPSPLDIANFVKDNPAFKVISLVSSLASLTLGIWGLLAHRRLAAAREEPWRILPT
ncbi:MAG TPA: hypothetical protein VKF61_01755 [Candidatus Polarisedimenticolia bacterium]|nr:hypothetical protein [Candidatus Polarisedimenticolia bacterium]